MNKKKNKRIGIVTYHRAINYGAILQVYALQKKIKELGAKCVILDYRNKRLENKHKRRRISDCNNVKDVIKFLLLSKNQNIKYEKFRGFSDKYFDLSNPLYSKDDLIKIQDEYDKFIVGSDQVWNYKINDMDTTYLLDFVKDRSKKTSYAASFGVSSIPSEYKQKYFDLLDEFDILSIREKQGAGMIKELLSKEVQVVLDPTLLIPKEEWCNLAEETNLNRGKYILIYAFGGSKYIKDFAENVSKKTGYKIVCISNTYKMNIGIKYIKSAGPEEFLELFKNAEYIITNSFHGTAFSINFSKQFFTEMLPETKGVNSRLENLLELFGLEDRKLNGCDANVIHKRIDYHKVNRKLEAERKKSMALLKSIVQERNIQVDD